MSDIVIFHLKKLWPCNSNNPPAPDTKCARCGHQLYPYHTYAGHVSVCDHVGCRCRQFMVNLYQEIKDGRKTNEWRDASEYWSRILAGEPRSTFDMYGYGDAHKFTPEPSEAWFVVGYPKGNLPRLEADITALIFHRNSDQFEIQFDNVREVTE